jgi:hypothetical protein
MNAVTGRNHPMRIKPIETHYKGYRFRSRLEARWAVYFDALGLEYSYEHEGYDLGGIRYLPDFWLPQVQMWAEVKPKELTPKEFRMVDRLVIKSMHPCLLLVGPPAVTTYDCLDYFEGQQQIVDCILSMYKGYPIHEQRFYSEPGGNEFDYRGIGFDDVFEAVEAARSARFEHGESG